MYKKWHACACPRSQESCWRFVVSPKILCGVCEIGCGELRLCAPSGISLMDKLIAAHEPMVMDYQTKLATE